MRNRFLLGAGVALAVALSWADARAQLFAMPGGPGAWYFGGEGGWTTLENAERQTPAASAFRQNFNDGFNIGARAGYEWGPLRVEEEFSFRQNGINSVNVAGCQLQHQRQSQYLRVHDQPDLRLHLRLAVLAAYRRRHRRGRAARRVGRSRDRHRRQLLDWVFGYQGDRRCSLQHQPGPGVRRRLSLPGDDEPDFRHQLRRGPLHLGLSLAQRPGQLERPVRRAAAAGRAPPLPPAPPPIARKVFLVFFDWDRDTITPEGMQIIQQAAAAFRAGAPVTIQVTGYTDRSGSPGYNQRLSERRANNVANALVRLGVPRQQMAVSGRGENDNRVPTADGVREPQNRRVEIVFP